jgi:hypothetical protein
VSTGTADIRRMVFMRASKWSTTLAPSREEAFRAMDNSADNASLIPKI